MSVIVSISIKADSRKLEAWAAMNRDTMARILEQAKQHGCMAHRFYGDDEGTVMVLDEWPDGDSFHTFFQASMGDIQPMITAADGQGQPEVRVWHALETGDEFGWGA